MVLVVPFDGSELSKTALVRAARFDTVLEEGVLAVTAIPSGNAGHARERGWVDDGDSFDGQRVVE
jgi:nucleotide-binding universal stress UspA family protein